VAGHCLVVPRPARIGIGQRRGLHASSHAGRDPVAEGGAFSWRCVIGPFWARRAADLYWNSPFGPIRWRHAERDLMSCWLFLANTRRSSAVRNC